MPVMTRPRSGSCGRQARWHEQLELLFWSDEGAIWAPSFPGDCAQASPVSITTTGSMDSGPAHPRCAIAHRGMTKIKSMRNESALTVADQHNPADGGKPDDDRSRDRPYADADVADGLPFGFVVGDLAIAQLVLLVRVAHRRSSRCRRSLA